MKPDTRRERSSRDYHLYLGGLGDGKRKGFRKGLLCGWLTSSVVWFLALVVIVQMACSTPNHINERGDANETPSDSIPTGNKDILSKRSSATSSSVGKAQAIADDVRALRVSRDDFAGAIIMVFAIAVDSTEVIETRYIDGTLRGFYTHRHFTQATTIVLHSKAFRLTRIPADSIGVITMRDRIARGWTGSGRESITEWIRKESE